MTTDMFGIQDTTNRTERAEKAVRAFRAMQHGLSGYARAITGDKSVKIQVAEGGPRTDGKTIYFRPPIALGDLTPHKRALCELRDPDTMQQRCPACRVREEVLIQIYHEIAHIAFGTFEEPTASAINEALERAIEEAPGKYADKIREGWDKIPAFQKKDHLNLSSLISPWLPTLVNALEDARVDESMFRARKGTRVMFDALTKGIFANGYEVAEGEYLKWSEKPLNSQILIGVFVLACKYDYQGWFSPEVEEALRDKELREIVWCINSARSVESSYSLAFPILRRLRELGFCRRPDDPEEDPTSDDEPEDSQEQGEPDEGETGQQDKASSEDQQDAEQPSGDASDESEDEAGDPESDADVESEHGAPAEAGDDSDDAETSDDSEGDASEGDGPELGPEPGAQGEGSDDDDAGEGDDSEESGDDAGGAEADGSSDGGESEDSESSELGSNEADSDPGSGEGESGPDSDSESTDGLGDDSPAQDVHQGQGELSDELDDAERDTSASSSSSGEWEDSEVEGSEDDASRDASGPSDADRGEERQDDPFSDDWLADEPSDSEEEVEAEPVDTGADAGEGGTEVNKNSDFGNPEDAAKDLNVFTQHEVIHDESDPSDHDEERIADEKALDRAIVQGEYFETPSSNIFGVRVHKFDQHIMEKNRDLSFAWHGQDDDVWAIRSGIKSGDDFNVPEQILGPALLEMRRVLADNARATHQKHLTSGRINASVLGRRAWAKDERLFQKKRLPGKRSYAVLIGIDISGSTYGLNLTLAKRAAKAQAELCNRLGLDFAVYAHTANGSYEVNELFLDMYEIKSFEQPWSTQAKEALNKIGADAANLDGHSIEFYRKMIERHPATDKIILYYSDGKMPAENHDEELEILIREIRTCKQKDITLMGVGIRTDSPRRHGLDTVEVESDEDLRKVIRHLESRLLR